MIQQPQNQYYPQYPQQFQPQFQSMQRQVLNGKFVNNESDIFPAEIPMDGSISYFPTQDGTIIFSKAWDNTGKIVTKIFKEITAADENKIDVEFLNDTLADINSRLNKLEQRQYHAPNGQKNRKDGDNNA